MTASCSPVSVFRAGFPVERLSRLLLAVPLRDTPHLLYRESFISHLSTSCLKSAARRIGCLVFLTAIYATSSLALANLRSAATLRKPRTYSRHFSGLPPSSSATRLTRTSSPCLPHSRASSTRSCNLPPSPNSLATSSPRLRGSLEGGAFSFSPSPVVGGRRESGAATPTSSFHSEVGVREPGVLSDVLSWRSLLI